MEGIMLLLCIFTKLNNLICIIDFSLRDPLRVHLIVGLSMFGIVIAQIILGFYLKWKIEDRTSKKSMIHRTEKYKLIG